MFKMALQHFVCVLMIILLCKGCHSQQPACGRPVINSRITGGQSAPAGRWPWHAVIKVSSYAVCQGSLITDQWVLTAAECSSYQYLFGSEVHLGVENLNGYNPNEVIREIEVIVCHPDFSYSNWENNICLLKLSVPVNFTDYVQPVCLASAHSTFYNGTTSWVTGFESYSLVQYFQEVDVSVVGNKQCNCYYDYNNYGYEITEKMMCAGAEKDASYQDRGTALVTKHDSVWVQSGILSRAGSYPEDRPSVYTRVSEYQTWINDRVTGMKPGFVTVTSPGNHSDINVECSPEDSIFSGGENLIHFTHMISLSVLVLFLHVFVGKGGV